MEEQYQGWSNRETWAADLWLSNDEYLYNTAIGIVEHETSDLAAGEALVHFLRGLDHPLINADVGSWWRIDEAELGSVWRGVLC